MASDSSSPEAAASSDEIQGDARLEAQVVRSTVWVAASRWGTVLVSWPITLLLARLLTPQDYGYIALVSVFTRFAALIAEGGLAQTIVLGRDLSGEQYRRLHGWSISLFMLSALVLAALSGPVERLYGTPGIQAVMLALTISLVLEGITMVPAARMRRAIRLPELSMILTVRVITDGVVSLICALNGLSYWSLVIGYISGRLIDAALVLRLSGIRPLLPTVGGLKDVLLDAQRLLVGSASTFLAHSSDAWAGAVSAGTGALGGYTYMVGLARSPLDKLSGIVIYVAGSVFGNLRNDPERLARVIVRMTRLTMLGMLPVFVGLALVADDLILGVLGDKWMPYLPALRVFCVYAAIDPLIKMLQEGTIAGGDSGAIAKVGVLLMLIMPIGFWYLGGRYGATGLAITWLIPLPIVLARLLAALSILIGLRAIDLATALWRPLVGVALMALAIWAADSTAFMGAASPLPRLGLEVLVGFVTYCPVAVLLQREDIRWLLTRISPRLAVRYEKLLTLLRYGPTVRGRQ